MRPKRTDNPIRMNFYLSAETRRLLDALARKSSREEGMDRSMTEMVQRAVRRMAEHEGLTDNS